MKTYEPFNSLVYNDKFSKIVIKSSPRKCGYLVSTFLKNGTYVGCTHIECDELEDFIKYQLNGYEKEQ